MNHPVIKFLEKYELALTLIIVGIPFLAITPIILIQNGFSFPDLIIGAVFGCMYSIIAFFIIRASRERKSWKVFAPKLGLNYREWPFSSMDGVYRNHHVEIYLKVEDNDGPSRSTVMSVSFNNPRRISIHLTKKGLLEEIRKRLFQVPETIVDDPEFDQKFVIRGSNESVIKTILDPSIRKKIMNIKNFHITIDGNEAYFEESGFIMDTKRLQSVLDITIDILEKIEKR